MKKGAIFLGRKIAGGTFRRLLGFSKGISAAKEGRTLVLAVWGKPVAYSHSLMRLWFRGYVVVFSI